MLGRYKLRQMGVMETDVALLSHIDIYEFSIHPLRRDRQHHITESDLRPIFIGSQGNLGLGGPPPLIGAPQGAAPADAAGTTTPGASAVRLPGAAPGLACNDGGLGDLHPVVRSKSEGQPK